MGFLIFVAGVAAFFYFGIWLPVKWEHKEALDEQRKALEVQRSADEIYRLRYGRWW